VASPPARAFRARHRELAAQNGNENGCLYS
jgi:hypothetical protein